MDPDPVPPSREIGTMLLRGPRSTAILALALLMLANPASAGVQTYIALGDSGAFGVGANDSSTDISNGDRGYVGPFADTLGARQGGTRPNLFNLGISGETSSSFFQSGAGLGGVGATLRNTHYTSPPMNPPASQNSLLLSTMGFFAYPPEKVYSRRYPVGTDGAEGVSPR
jgi:hypothetical protein